MLLPPESPKLLSCYVLGLVEGGSQVLLVALAVAVEVDV